MSAGHVALRCAVVSGLHLERASLHCACRPETQHELGIAVRILTCRETPWKCRPMSTAAREHLAS